MADFQTTNFVRYTRKIHRCVVCERKIPVGLSAHHMSGKNDGVFYSSYCCNTCYQLLKEFPDAVTDWNDGYIDTQAYIDNCTAYGCSRPLQLLHRLREEENGN